ncbi:hypothetical protein [Prauserella cavernicola]|uniref:Uncharacterized protein n=1 Tax=Prauserella cavernicola TaxID=2800127 RepID=A0A934QNG5_9PSEU|nr:hypothetical protein [Prauserella cavernicola]MBK1783435.1 hypothetical protein [Prauserella cavernicola]
MLFPRLRARCRLRRALRAWRRELNAVPHPHLDTRLAADLADELRAHRHDHVRGP